MTPELLLLASLVCAALAVVGIRRMGPGPWARRAVSGSLVYLLLVSGLYVVSDYFTGAGLDESVFYHLQYGLDGAGFAEYKGLIAAATLLLLATVSAFFACNRTLKRPRQPASQRTAASAALLPLAFAINPANADLAFAIRARIAPVDQAVEQSFAAYNMIPEAAATRPPKNLLYVYVESLERTYLDETLFPGLAEGIRRLEASALSFTDIVQLPGTNWTVAGMTASQCGLPLVTSSGGNAMGGMDEFLPGARCLGDLLRARGYRLSYMGGAKLEFAGKGKFYRTHGFDSVRGLDELAPAIQDPDYRNGWGLFDDSLFEMAEAHLEELAKVEEPFGLFLLTLDTHHPNGHPSKSCDGLTYGDGSNPILNAVRCSDHLVSRFVDRIRRSKLAKNTLIVIGSDHLAMRNTATPLLERGERRNLLIVLDPSQGSAPRKIKRAGSTLDVGPTVLGLLGFDAPALGLGRNLLRQAPTLVQEFDDPSAKLDDWRSSIESMWEYPRLGKGILVDATRKLMRFGERVMELPALVTIGNEGRLAGVYFPAFSPKPLEARLLEEQDDTPIIWADYCAKVSALAPDGPPATAEALCLFAGRLGSPTARVVRIDKTFFVTSDEVLADASAGAIEKPIADSRRSKVQTLVAYGTANPTIVTLGARAGRDVFVRSAGTPAELSTARGSGDEPGGGVRLSRGLTLLGTTANAGPVKLAHVDSCDPDNPVTDDAPATASFADTIRDYSSAFEAFIIVAHDSAVCAPGFDFEGLFGGLPLDQWRKLDFNRPYIAVVPGEMTPTEPPIEILGLPRETLSVLVRGLPDRPAGSAGN